MSVCCVFRRAIQPRGLGSPESGTKVTNTEEVLEDSVTLKGGDDYEQYQESGKKEIQLHIIFPG